MSFSISISPSQLNISKDKILDILREKYNYTHHKEYGYIINIINIKKIINTFIDDYNYNIIIQCKCDIDHIVLKKGAHIPNCTITMVLLHGIFLKFHTLCILIPATTLTSFTYHDNVFKHKDKQLSVGDIIDVIITDIQYSNQEYKCIGSYVNCK